MGPSYSPYPPPAEGGGWQKSLLRLLNTFPVSRLGPGSPQTGSLMPAWCSERSLAVMAELPAAPRARDRSGNRPWLAGQTTIGVALNSASGTTPIQFSAHSPPPLVSAARRYLSRVADAWALSFSFFGSFLLRRKSLFSYLRSIFLNLLNVPLIGPGMSLLVPLIGPRDIRAIPSSWSWRLGFSH